jgi:hypothetical protein
MLIVPPRSRPARASLEFLDERVIDCVSRNDRSDSGTPFSSVVSIAVNDQLNDQIAQNGGMEGEHQADAR